MSFPRSFLAAGISTLLLTSCGSERASVQKMLADTLLPEFKAHLPEGAEIDRVDAVVTAQAGLEFTGKASAEIRFPAFYALVPLDDAAAEEQLKTMSIAFDTAVQVPRGGRSAEDNERFSKLVDRSWEGLTPGFVQTLPEGQVIRATFNSVDGRRSGDSVRLARLDPPEFDWPDAVKEPARRITMLPPGSRVYGSPSEMFGKLQNVFSNLLQGEVSSLVAARNEESDRRLRLVEGRWEGTAIQRIVDVANFNMETTFAAGGACRGVLSMVMDIRGIGVTRKKVRMEFSGSWELNGGKVGVTAKQTKWTESLQQIAGPGSDNDKEDTKEQVPLAEDMSINFDIDVRNEKLTFYPLGTNFKSATGFPMNLMVPIALARLPEPELPSPPPRPTPPQEPTKLKPSGSLESAGRATAPAGSSPNLGERASLPASSTAIKPSASLDDVAPFIPGPSSMTTPAGSPPIQPSDPAKPGEMFPVTRQRLLTQKDTENFDRATIQRALNEMYARHGLVFKDRAIQQHFLSKSWYAPDPQATSEQIESGFSPIETANRQLLVDLRKSLAAPSETRTAKAARPKRIFAPKDKLPDDLSGTGVAGEFLMIGTDRQGQPILIAREDRIHLAARRFCIVNPELRDNPNVILRINDYTPFSVPSASPLRFVGRDGIPGTYLVEVVK